MLVADLGMVGRNAQMLQVEQRVVGRDPLGLVEPPAPVAIGPARGQELFTPALRGNARPQVGAFLVQQIAVDLVLDGDVARQQPVDEMVCDRNRRHVSLLGGWASARAHAAGSDFGDEGTRVPSAQRIRTSAPSPKTAKPSTSGVTVPL